MGYAVIIPDRDLMSQAPDVPRGWALASGSREIDFRIQTSEYLCMTGKGLIRALRRRAKAGGRTFKVDRKRGKGSHAMVSFGERRSFVPLHGGDLPTGTHRAILRQLGVQPEELESEE